MTRFKPGDRVHVDGFDGEVNNPVGYPDWIHVKRDTGGGVYVPAELCTLVRPPLAVGDVLTADDPEPPRSTILQGATGEAWQRLTPDALGWFRAGGRNGHEWWTALESSPLTVLYVPEDTA